MNQKQQLAHLDAEINKAERENEAIRIRLDTLREMRNKLFTGRHRTTDSESGQTSTNGLLGPGKAIRSLVKDRPGMDAEAVIEELKGKIKTKSANQERLIRNTILNMIRDDILVKDELGGLRMK